MHQFHDSMSPIQDHRVVATMRQGLRFLPFYLLRKVVSPVYPVPCYYRSASGASHYLSSDAVDDLVLDEVVGYLADLYLPRLAQSTIDQLNKGGWILDVGAYNGFWAAEMLVRYPRAQAILVEPNATKQQNIARTLQSSKLLDRTRLVPAGLGSMNGRGYLVKSDEGAWGNWVQMTTPAGAALAGEIELRTLPDVLAGAQPVVVKCNAEGAEFDLVDQLMALDRRPDLLILMVHPEHGAIDALWNLLESHGYRLRVALEHERRPCWHATLG